MQPAHGACADAPAADGDAAEVPVGDDPWLPLPPAGGDEQGGGATPLADPVQRAQGQVIEGARGVGAMLLPAPREAPLTSASGRQCAATRHLGWEAHVPPPPSREGRQRRQWGGGSLGSGTAPAPTGRSGTPRWGRGSAEGQTPDPWRPILPSHRDTTGRGGGGQGGRHSHFVTHNPLALPAAQSPRL